MIAVGLHTPHDIFEDKIPLAYLKDEAATMWYSLSFER